MQEVVSGLEQRQGGCWDTYLDATLVMATIPAINSHGEEDGDQEHMQGRTLVVGFQVGFSTYLTCVMWSVCSLWPRQVS